MSVNLSGVYFFKSFIWRSSVSENAITHDWATSIVYWFSPLNCDWSLGDCDFRWCFNSRRLATGVDGDYLAYGALTNMVDWHNIEAIRMACHKVCSFEITHGRNSFTVIDQTKVTMQPIVHVKSVTFNEASWQLGFHSLIPNNTYSRLWAGTADETCGFGGVVSDWHSDYIAGFWLTYFVYSLVWELIVTARCHTLICEDDHCQETISCVAVSLSWDCSQGCGDFFIPEEKVVCDCRASVVMCWIQLQGYWLCWYL